MKSENLVGIPYDNSLRAPAGLKVTLGVALLAVVTGCVGYVGPGGGGVIVPVPEVTVFGGGFYERGHDVHEYSHRGYESRGEAHRGGDFHGGRR